MKSDCSGFDLVNSENWFSLAPGRDRLQSEPDWLDDFLVRWGFTRPERSSRRELLRLRAVLRRLTTDVAAGEPVPPADLDAFNGFLAARHLRRRLDERSGTFRLELEPDRADWAWILSEIAGSVAALLTAGEPARLKLCENPECRWVFYDRGKNRRRRWCHPAICGNRDRVRRFRDRRRTPA